MKIKYCGFTEINKRIERGRERDRIQNWGNVPLMTFNTIYIRITKYKYRTAEATLQFRSIWPLLRMKQQQISRGKRENEKKIPKNGNNVLYEFESLILIRWIVWLCASRRVSSFGIRFGGSFRRMHCHCAREHLPLHSNVMSTQWDKSNIYMMWYVQAYHKHLRTDRTDKKEEWTNERKKERKKLYLFLSQSHPLLRYFFSEKQYYFFIVCIIADHIDKVNIPVNRIDLQIIWYAYNNNRKLRL